ncbi:MAG: Nif3-like dinuclear metal center hexameric protein, partial [Planctomycetota bacterium]
IAVYSAHTAFDSAKHGINQRLAQMLNLNDIQPLIPAEDPEDAAGGIGAGRSGKPSPGTTLRDVSDVLASALSLRNIRRMGAEDVSISRVAIACGSGGSFVGAARRCGADLLITGEATFHTCLEAQAAGMAMLLTGHFASERFAMEQWAMEIQVWADKNLLGSAQNTQSSHANVAVFASQADISPVVDVVVDT